MHPPPTQTSKGQAHEQRSRYQIDEWKRVNSESKRHAEAGRGEFVWHAEGGMSQPRTQLHAFLSVCCFFPLLVHVRCSLLVSLIVNAPAHNKFAFSPKRVVLSPPHAHTLLSQDCFEDRVIACCVAFYSPSTPLSCLTTAAALKIKSILSKNEETKLFVDSHAFLLSFSLSHTQLFHLPHPD